jgi:hypothetical protein
LNAPVSWLPLSWLVVVADVLPLEVKLPSALIPLSAVLVVVVSEPTAT